MLGSYPLFLLLLVGSKLLVQVGSASHPADAGWREPGFGMQLRALQRLGLVEVGGLGACRAALWAQHQSPHLTWDSRATNLGTSPRGRSAPLSCLARDFCWHLSGSSKFGRNQYRFCWERWKTKAAPLLWLPQTILDATSCQAALPADVSQLESKAIPPGVSMTWQATHTVPSAPIASPGMLAVPLAARSRPCPYPGPSLAAKTPSVKAALGRGKHGTYTEQCMQVFKNNAIRIFVIQIACVYIKCLISDSNVV